MQPSIKVQNKSVDWSVRLRPRVGDTVKFNGSYYSNYTGKNSSPSFDTDWVLVSLAAPYNPEPVLFTALSTGINQVFVLPPGFLARSVLKSKAELFKGTEWNQIGQNLTIMVNTNTGNSIYVKP